MLRFERTTIPQTDPDRADVALFVGLVARRSGVALPSALVRWLAERGWVGADYPLVGGVRSASPQAKSREAIEGLLDVPVPVDSWAAFEELFAYERRPVTVGENTPTIDSYLGAAVRSFFAQGGRRCYVVRVGDPLPYDALMNERQAQLERLVPGYVANVPTANALEPSTWQGIGHLFGLADVAFVALPDLTDLCRADVASLPLDEPIFNTPEIFVECSTRELPPPPNHAARLLAAPRADEGTLPAWRKAIRLGVQVLSRHHRTVQFVASLPRPTSGTLVGLMGTNTLTREVATHPDGIATAFLQLTTPWLVTGSSARLPEGSEPPDGTLVGLLARNALVGGTFRPAAHQPLVEVFDVVDPLRRDEQEQPQLAWGDRALRERVSLFGQTPEGLILLSDVTTSRTEAYRPANVNRLMSLILRAAQRFGDDLLFEPNGEGLWGRVRDRMEGLLTDLHTLGALRGERPADAFTVRCDRSTMSQNDIDNGRLICEVAFTPTLPIERITVLLTLQHGGGLLVNATTRAVA
jgi:hypothetical protein